MATKRAATKRAATKRAATKRPDPDPAVYAELPTPTAEVVYVVRDKPVAVTEGRRMIGPDLAAAMLRNQVEAQRIMRPTHTELLAADMSAGLWDIANDAIVIDTAGMLVNGQHRLTAVVMSGKPQPFAVMVIDAADSAAIYAELDQGKTRTMADFLRLRGWKDYVAVAAIARGGYAWDHGRRITGTIVRGYPKPTKHQLELWLRDNTEPINEAAHAYRRMQKLHPRARVHGGFYLVMRRNPDTRSQIEYFFEDLHTGQTPHQSGPWLLRESMLKNANAAERMTAYAAMAELVQAWNLYYEGATATYLRRWNPGRRRVPAPLGIEVDDDQAPDGDDGGGPTLSPDELGSFIR